MWFCGGIVYPGTLLSVLIKSNSGYCGKPSQGTFALNGFGGTLELFAVVLIPLGYAIFALFKAFV